MVTVVTKAVGGTAKPVGVLYGEPDRQVEDASAGTALENAGVNAPFVADLLSSCLAHERCGVHLYRSVAGRTTFPDLRDRYEEFLAETERHVELLEELIAGAGGDPMYVSPTARATEAADARLVETTWAVEGSVDAPTAELAMLEAVLLAEIKDHDNWLLISELADAMADGPVRDQMRTTSAEVLAQEVKHAEWARQTRRRMLYLAATGSEPPTVERAAADGAASEAEAMTKEQLYEEAKELGIEGRSSMTKDELAAAVSAEHEQEARA